jgi:hypothetical protein
MNYNPNTTQWRVGDIVIHDADAKEPRMLMRIVDFDFSVDQQGLAQCQYVDLRHDREIYPNQIASLHDPARFGIYKEWAESAQWLFEDIQAEWDWCRRWNYYKAIGVKVRTTSADGGFEAYTSSKAAVWNTGTAMIRLEPGGYWALKFVEVIADVEISAPAENQL